MWSTALGQPQGTIATLGFAMTPARLLVALLATATTVSIEGKTVIGPGPGTFVVGPGAACTHATRLCVRSPTAMPAPTLRSR